MSEPIFRAAAATDLPRILALIADDTIGAARESSAPAPHARHEAAFREIAADDNQLPLLLEVDGEVVGYLQITFIPGLSRRGAWRGQLESVRIASTHRRRGLGGLLIEHAVALCRERGCALVQLTTDTTRDDARRFYEAHGFVASHHGMKRA